jgi:hypothetical protein
MTGYTQQQRLAHAEQHLLVAASLGFLAETSCTHIARTYGISSCVQMLKAQKARLFPEFLSNGDGK